MRAPVGLGNEAVLGPVEVGLVGAQRTVGVGRGEVVLLAQGEELALEDAAQNRLLRVLRDRFGQLRGAVAVRVSIEDSLDLVEIQDAELLRAIDGGDEDAVWHHLRNVEEGAGEAGEGEAAVLRHLRCAQRAAVEGDAGAGLAAVARRDRDLYPLWACSEEPVQVRGAAMAQDRSVAAGEHGGAGVASAGEGGVKCIDALMNPVQAPASCSLRDRVTAQAQCLELPAAGHPFMACHEPGNRGLGGSRGAFSTHMAHMAHKAPSACGSPPSGPDLARERS